MKPRPTLLLIDISSFIFRAFFAIRKLNTSKGLPTNAIYGVTTMLTKALENLKPEYVACVFDTPKPTFRKEMYPDYKANRGAPPDELIPQFDYIPKLVHALGLKELKEPGFEADDIIATLTKRFSDCEILIATGDKDLMQLVDGHVKIVDTMKDVIYDAKGVREKLGVDPDQVTDFLGLTGDSSDNIPGVPGIGPKTAVELLSEHKSLEKVLAATSKMKAGKRRETLEQHAEDARLSKKLATVRDDVGGLASKIKLEELKHPESMPATFGEFLREMEFRTLLKKYEGSEPAAEVTGDKKNLRVIQDAKQWEACKKELSQSEAVAFEIFGLGEHYTDLKMTGVVLHGTAKESMHVEFGDLKAKQVFEDLSHWTEGKTLVTHDLKIALKYLRAEGAKLKGRFFDTMLAHYMVEPEEKHELEVLRARYLEDSGSTDSTAAILRLREPLQTAMGELGVTKLYEEVELPVAEILADMESNGIAVDPDVLKSLSKEYAHEMTKIEKDIFQLAGTEFNLNSPKQLSDILFVKLGLPVIQKTKTGFSTDISVLEKLSPMHPLPANMVRYRELNKLKNTYVDVLPGLIEKDGRVHALFNQAVAATGRLSSSDPNLQNIPIKTESGKKIRKAFVAAPGMMFVGADYSQIELRLVAHMSGDEALIKAFQSHLDIHRATAAEILHIKAEEVTDAQRSAAKAINFGLIYGKTAFGLAQELDIPRHEAQAYIDAYFKRYKGVKAFMDEAIASARKTQRAVTLYGRVRHIRDLGGTGESKNLAIRGNAERMAMNAPVQGTAADIIKMAMIRAAHACEPLGAKMVLQVHDELVFEAPKGKAEAVKEKLIEAMESAAKLSVKLEVNAGIADNWMDL